MIKNKNKTIYTIYMDNIETKLNKPLYVHMIHDEYNLDISPLVVGYERCEKGKPEIHLEKNFFVLHYVISGTGYVQYEGQERQSVHAGSCFIYTPGSVLKYMQSKEDPWFYFWIEITGDSVQKIFSDFSNDFRNKIIQVQNKKTFHHIIKKLFDESLFVTSNRGEALRTNGLIDQLFSQLLDEHLISKSTIYSMKKEEQIKSIIRYINSNYSSSEINVQTIAEKFFYNASYLSRVFKEFTGMPIIKYIITLRMRRAVELIEIQSFSISQIAYSLGYKNQFYFSKEFKKFYGISPSKYLDALNSNHS